MEHCYYYRATFTVYWSDSAPSTEVFYLTRRPFCLSPTNLSGITDQVLKLMKVYHGEIRVTGAIYIGGEILDEMTEADIKKAGWHVLKVDYQYDLDQVQTLPLHGPITPGPLRLPIR